MKSIHYITSLALIALALLTSATLTPAGAQTIHETSKILASDGAAYDRFGTSAAIDGSIAIVGANGHEEQGFLSGSAYLFDISDPANPTEIAELLPIGGSWKGNFGGSVGISGTTAVVGADEYNDPISGFGSAYLFDVTTGTQIAELLAGDGQAGDAFGCSVAIHGSTVIVGAYLDDDMGDGSGSAYLFDASTGTQITKLVPGDGDFQDLFGSSVALSGTTALIGAPYDDDNDYSGSAYLFDTSDGTQLAKFSASDGEYSDGFGNNVAIHGSIAIIAATGDDDHGQDSGSAYLFDVSNPANPVQLAKLIASDGAPFDSFGFSVAVSEDHALVGSRHDENGENSGCAYLFDISDPTSPVQVAKLLSSDNTPADWFSFAVALGDTTALGTSTNDSNSLGTYAGSAYLFDLSSHPNDECANPIVIAGQGTFPFDTTGASTNSDPATTGTNGQNEALCFAFGTSAINNDVWYSWTANATGLATVSFCNGGTTHDTKVASWPAVCPPVPDTSLACNDDACSYQSEIQFNVTNGTNYLIQLGSFFSTATGAGTFDISIQGAPGGPGTPFCFGDGTGTPCPCGNVGAQGEGCANDTGSGGSLTGSGSNSVGSDDLVLSSTGLTPGPGLFFQGNNAINAGNGNPFGDGLRCAGNQVIRLEIQFSSGGASQTTISVPTKGGVSAGDTKRYQHWYRDTGTSPCNSLFNLTNGYEITWTP
jgi:hypothetical protein